ncbi:MAG TPA: PLP-dependent aspartate aminotransferase family protein [Polyangiaceae bacterium]|nr:PLP-dependent aspartate aminotransferase family protein [Polyangiaceae bacterium]
MQRPSLDTIAIHAGQAPDPLHGAVMPPIVLSTTFAQDAPGKPKRYEYSRSGNPTREALEQCLAALEGGRFGFAFASGSAAALVLLQTLSPGDHVLANDDVYGGTFRLLDKVLRPLGITTTFTDLRDPSHFDAAVTATTRLVWVETPSNPLLKLLDLRALGERAAARGIALVVDNTFATPVLQRPLELGAHVVLHSTTKYINGHSDVVGGALVTNDERLGERLRFLQNAIGAVPSPMDCYLVLRGIKTLPLRMRQHVASAAELARRLAHHSQVKRVLYPGLPDHPEHVLCLRQMSGPGGMISLELSGGMDEAERFLRALRVFALAESLGGVESLAEQPALMTHASIPADVRRATGITDSLVRLSVGLEGVEDLWDDLEQGLARSAGA